MSKPSMKFRGICALAALTATLALSACLQNTGVVSKTGQALTKGQSNCLAPDAAAVKNIAQRLTASAIVVGGDFCAKPEGYECYARKFGVTLSNGTSTVEERAHVAELGGDFAIKVETHTYNTREAATSPGVSSSATLAGGDYNRSEYVCHQHDLKDGDNYLAIGEAESLNEALAGAYAKCTGVAPRLVSER